jgi:hypothetical protein
MLHFSQESMVFNFYLQIITKHIFAGFALWVCLFALLCHFNENS